MASMYSSGQSSRYLNYLSLTLYKAYAQDPQVFPKTEETMTVLFQAQIARFPYKNLSIFLSETRLVDINKRKKEI